MQPALPEQRASAATPAPYSGHVAAPSRCSDSSVSAIAAGFLAMLVSLAGPLAFFYQAAQAGPMSETFASWVWGHLAGRRSSARPCGVLIGLVAHRVLRPAPA